VGGLKATFLTDFVHTTIALILLIYFSLAVLTNEHIGGVSGLYEKVKATNNYIPGNYEGSLLTLKSKSCKSFTGRSIGSNAYSPYSCFVRFSPQVRQPGTRPHGYRLLAKVIRLRRPVDRAELCPCIGCHHCGTLVSRKPIVVIENWSSTKGLRRMLTDEQVYRNNRGTQRACH
jgi:hypothetical protein